MNIKEEFNQAYLELKKATIEKEEFEYIYEMEKCRMLFSAEVQGFGNQSQRDAQAKILLDEKGLEKKMIDFRTDAKIAWYKWETLRSLINNEK